ncbi:MAG: hypothetical protein FWD82_10365 [Defluviitaleaceae bacterium]|nr:hypothetical protein [Defluviitaleaceae bacterium]
MIKVTNSKTHKKPFISHILSIVGGVILICSILFAGYTVYAYYTELSRLTSLGALIAGLTLLFGVFFSFIAFGIAKIIEQNEEILQNGNNK